MSSASSRRRVCPSTSLCWLLGVDSSRLAVPVAFFCRRCVLPWWRVPPTWENGGPRLPLGVLAVGWQCGDHLPPRGSPSQPDDTAFLPSRREDPGVSGSSLLSA